MTKIEALELELAARKMVEGTTVCWTDVIKCDGMKQSYFIFNAHRDQYEFALGIIEGKVVWEGDTIYGECGADRADANMVLPGKWSWNPPVKAKGIINKNPAEIQSGHDRQKWAEGLILQMASSHNGRNSWLLNYGVSEEANALRRDHPSKPQWSEYYQSAETTSGKMLVELQKPAGQR